MCGQQNGVAGSDRRGSGSIVGNPELIAQVLINASILSEVVRQLRLDQSNGFNSGTLSIEPFGGSRCRGVLATTYAFSMVFSWSEKEREASSAEKRTPENSGLERGTLLRTSDGCAKPSLSECTDTPPATELETTRSECRRVVDG